MKTKMPLTEECRKLEVLCKRLDRDYVRLIALTKVQSC